MLWFSLISAVIGIIYGAFLIKNILGKDAGSETMRKISDAIKEGASAYLNRQYKTIAVIAVIVFILLWILTNITTGLGFLVGAVLSGVAGYIGMNVSVRANVRTAEAAKKGMKEALSVAVKGGTVT